VRPAAMFKLLFRPCSQRVIHVQGAGAARALLGRWRTGMAIGPADCVAPPSEVVLWRSG
jgi:hypothetical protein